MNNNETPERHWPYANSFALETLDSTVIQSQAEAVLSRVLTAGRAIAFVGSGVSDCYGRMSWTEMVYRLQERALERGGKAIAGSRVARLHESLKRDPIKRASTARSDALPIRAELAIRLYDEACAADPTRAADRTRTPDRTRTAPASARDLVKQDIVDDSGHARSLLFDGLSGMLSETARAELRDSLDQLDKHELRAIFSRQPLDALLGPPTAKAPDTLATRLFQLTQEVAGRAGEDPSPNRVLRSRRRFLLALALATNPSATLRDGFLAQPFAPIDRPRRFHFVERERDPLMLLYDDLGFRRFITTNYDREIERLFRDKSLTLTGDVTHEADPPGDDHAPQAVGQDTARVIVYEQKKAGALVAFAAQDKLRGPGLVYLHGRAADEDDIVVGEADYRELYLKQTPYRALSQAALELTFGANPIVFLGLGMNEDDVLRPLRDFMSGRESLSQRPVIAIMPQPVSLADGATKASNLLARYGVLTLYYGSELVPDRTPISGKGKNVPWMAQAIEIIKSCRSLAEQLERGADDAKLAEPRDKLRTAFAVLGDAPEAGDWSLASPHVGKDVSAALDLTDDLRFLSTIGHGLFHARGDGSIKHIVPAIGGTLSAIHSSIQGAFLCERIARLRIDRNSWFEHWMFLNRQKSPPSTLLSVDHIAAVKEWNRPHQKWERSKLDAHKLDKLSSLEQVRSFGMPELEAAPRRTEKTVSDVPAQRFYAGAVSQTFNNLLAALEDHPDIKSVQRRRTFLFVGRRGLGRGHFIAAMKSPQRISELSYRLCDKTKWHSAGFYSIAHTTDFADVVADISRLLKAYLQGVANTHQNPLKEELQATVGGMDELGEAKMDALSFGLTTLGKLGEKNGHLPRLLLVLNSFDILFDEFGNEKNASIRRFANLLASDKIAAAPVDLILICNEQNIPNQFRDGTDGGPTQFGQTAARSKPALFTPLLLRTTQLDERARQALDNRVAALPVEVDRAASVSGGEYLHVLRGARASIVMTSFFPRLALMFGVGIALQLGLEIKRGIGNDRSHQREDWASLILDVRNEIEGRKKDDDAPYGGSSTRGPRRGDLMLAGERAVNKLVSILRGDADATTLRRPLLVGAHGAALTDTQARKLYDRLDDALRQMAKLSGGRRYALTLLAATAFDMSSDYIRGPQPESPEQELAWFARTCREVTEFLEANTTILASQEAPERDTAIVRLCIDELRRRHERFRALPLEVPTALTGLDDTLLGPDMFSLQHTVLWHLAAFGQPVSLEALKRCPSLVDVANQMASRAPETNKPVAALLEFALEILVNRCLVMQIEGLSGKLFTVHRTVQLHLLRHLGSPSVEYQTVNQFTVTSYMTQPRDMPRLRREAHHELRRTISALIAYPNADGRSEQLGLPPQLTAPPASPDMRTRPARKGSTPEAPPSPQLQAALAMMRSVYSVASVARLGSPDGEPIVPDSETGLFGEHAQQVRWLLHMNGVIQRNGLEAGLLTQDQIVWALNECGVVSLIRGNLGDAAASLDFADRECEKIEPRESDPTRNRIFLNRALVLIERGQGRGILRRLGTIASDRDEHPAIRAVANGYQGLVYHLSGRYDAAEAHYLDSLRSLSRQDRARSASFVARNLGNLYRSTKRMPEAGTMIQSAVNFADEGSHQDVLQEALVARCALWIRENKRDVTVHAQLTSAERYARTMGMGRLLSEIHRLRGVLRLESGDYFQASRDFAEALRIAVANRQKLRVISCLAHLAEAQTESGAFESCRPMLDMATAMAQATEHHSGLMHAERLRMRSFGKVAF